MSRVQQQSVIGLVKVGYLWAFEYVYAGGKVNDRPTHKPILFTWQTESPLSTQTPKCFLSGVLLFVLIFSLLDDLWEEGKHQERFSEA